MRIEYVEIANFRKLLAVRIDLAKQTTLFVGANNSGKTSAMLALRYFLISSGVNKFTLNDFTLSHRHKINEIGAAWRKTRSEGESPDLQLNEWHEVTPTLDLWLHVENGEIHRVSKLIPTLDWPGGILGVRLCYEPKDAEMLRKDFLSAVEHVEELKKAAADQAKNYETMPNLGPENMVTFLERKLPAYFCIKAYALDPSKIMPPKDGLAQRQILSPAQEPIDIASLKELIRVDEINAQRIFGDDADGKDGSKSDIKSTRQLSLQLRNYYSKHLDPSTDPEVSDLKALAAIEQAQKAFDERLEAGFKAALAEVEGLGYPGVTDPRIKVSTLLRPIEGLDHETAVQYEVGVTAETDTTALRLPEQFNGLGYQNLISMIFRLMSFRDAWMKVGKAGKNLELDAEVPPINLVLVEEPEAHLHAQVQQVFIQKAYTVLRAHPDLKDNKKLCTQLIVSTHSSHVAHEADFSWLRYFRRLPAGLKAPIPISTVINLSNVFGAENDTKRFVTRYLKAQHCDLFFADAAILVEGPAERMLVPHFIRLHYPLLQQCYITLLEIGGSHAHRLRPLIEELKLLTLVITDLDTAGADGKSEVPEQGKGQVTNNTTLETWVPNRKNIDDLCVLAADQKICSDDGILFAVRASYQMPLKAKLENGIEETVLPYTFEDALVFENLSIFSKMNGKGLVAKFKTAITSSASPKALGAVMFNELKTGKKAEFALDVIDDPNFESLKTPSYIQEGLEWLVSRLQNKSTASEPSEIKNL